MLSAALVAAVLVTGTAAARAAQLGVNPAQLAVSRTTHPCLGTAVVGPADAVTYPNQQAVVVAAPTGCAGLPVQLHVDRPGTTQDRDGAGTTAADGVAAVRLGGTYSAVAANVITATVDGWSLPVSWNPAALPPIWCTVVDATGATCTATVAIRDTGVDIYWDVVVTTPSTSSTRWEVGFNLDHPFYGGRPVRLGNSDLDGYNDGQTQWAVAPGYTPANDVTRVSACAQSPVLLVEGTNTYATSANRFRDVRDARERRFSLVVNVTQTGYFDVLSPGCL